MKLYLSGHDCRYAAEQMLLTLFPGERPEYPDGAPEGERAELTLFEGEKRLTAVCRLVRGGKTFLGRAVVSKSEMTDALVRARLTQRAVSLSFYRAALASGVEKPVWGSLTGIRPGKLMSRLLEQGLSDRAALTEFVRLYDADPSRAELCLHTAHAALAAERSLAPQDVCLYVGIPFCPTRCAYCSFVSISVQKSMKRIPEYLAALDREIDATAETVKALSLRPVALYMGGGTPTTLSAAQLDTLCGKLETAFDLSSLREYTVEAGRPDTITREKLEALKRHGVTRVSVNPQTMDDSVLEAIGRKHTAQDVLNALAAVRQTGGFSVNMDLIAGLPADTPERFDSTLRTVLSLSPENVTVHTLALKKGSGIMRGETPVPDAAAVGEMIAAANAALFACEYRPYYLYRQKYMSGGFENVGWQKGGTESFYNICIMEELCSIFALGGGASTKLCMGNGRIERLFDPKYPDEYIDGIAKIVSDKEKIVQLLSRPANREGPQEDR
jgi:oxygen-independent coproporphyrinogen-3 oxidase